MNKKVDCRHRLHAGKHFVLKSMYELVSTSVQHATMLNNNGAIKSCFALKMNLRFKKKKECWISFNINARRWIFQLTNTSSKWKLLLPTKHCSCRYCNSSLSTSLPAGYIVRHCITLDTHILFCRSASQSHLPSS